MPDEQHGIDVVYHGLREENGNAVILIEILPASKLVLSGTCPSTAQPE